MYTVSQISQKLGISKAIIYKKLGSIEDISEHVIIKGRTKYIDDIGFEFIEKELEILLKSKKLEACTKEVLENKSNDLNICTEEVLENKSNDLIICTEEVLENKSNDLKICTEEVLENKSNDLNIRTKKISKNKYDELLEKNNKYIKMLEDELEYLKEEIQLKNNLIAEQSRQLGNNQLLLLENKKKILMLETSVTLEKDIKRRIIKFPRGLAIFKKFFTKEVT